MAAVSQEAMNSIAERGQALYDAQIRANVEENNRGEFLVLNVETGDYEIDAEDLIASRRLLSRLPHAAVYGVRIGYKSAYRIGGSITGARNP